jgi:hypothetical protein
MYLYYKTGNGIHFHISLKTNRTGAAVRPSRSGALPFAVRVTRLQHFAILVLLHRT